MVSAVGERAGRVPSGIPDAVESIEASENVAGFPTTLGPLRTQLPSVLPGDNSPAGEVILDLSAAALKSGDFAGHHVVGQAAAAENLADRHPFLEPLLSHLPSVGFAEIRHQSCGGVDTRASHTTFGAGSGSRVADRRSHGTPEICGGFAAMWRSRR